MCHSVHQLCVCVWMWNTGSPIKYLDSNNLMFWLHILITGDVKWPNTCLQISLYKFEIHEQVWRNAMQESLWFHSRLTPEKALLHHHRDVGSIPSSGASGLAERSIKLNRQSSREGSRWQITSLLQHLQLVLLGLYTLSHSVYYTVVKPTARLNNGLQCRGKWAIQIGRKASRTLISSTLSNDYILIKATFIITGVHNFAFVGVLSYTWYSIGCCPMQQALNVHQKVEVFTLYAICLPVYL